MITCKNNLGETVSLPKEKFTFRPGVYGIIRRNEKICICQNRSNGKIWFPGGGIEVGEKQREALLREIQEETGLKHVQIGKLIGSFENFFYYQPADLAMHSFLFFFECTTKETQFISNEEVQDDESYNFSWVNIKDIQKDDVGDLQEEIFEMLHSL